MRTGLIHLTGLAATLLLLFTLIAWADSSSHFCIADYIRGPREVAFLSAHGRLIWDLVYRQSENPTVVDESEHSISFNRRPAYRIDWLQPAWQWGKFGFTFIDKVEFEVTTKWESLVVLPHWFVALCLAIPAALYLRFLYRRRHPPASAPRSGEGDGVASAVGD